MIYTTATLRPPVGYTWQIPDIGLVKMFSCWIVHIFATQKETELGWEQTWTRMLLLQATVKRFQFDLYVNLEGQQMLIRSWFQK